MDELKNHLRREALKFHVGTAIFCPSCSKILDAKSSVELDWLRNGELVKTFVQCATCYDSNADIRARLQALHPEIVFEAHDGRLLFATTKSAATAAVAAANGLPMVDIPAQRRPIHKADVEIGKRYQIHHTSGWVTVRVLGFKGTDIRSRSYGAEVIGRRRQYRCLNEKTGREIIVKSAAKFQREV
jgi:hypothetical protein